MAGWVNKRLVGHGLKKKKISQAKASQGARLSSLASSQHTTWPSPHRQDAQATPWRRGNNYAIYIGRGPPKRQRRHAMVSSSQTKIGPQGKREHDCMAYLSSRDKSQPQWSDRADQKGHHSKNKIYDIMMMPLFNCQAKG